MLLKSTFLSLLLIRPRANFNFDRSDRMNLDDLSPLIHHVERKITYSVQLPHSCGTNFGQSDVIKFTFLNEAGESSYDLLLGVLRVESCRLEEIKPLVASESCIDSIDTASQVFGATKQDSIV